MDNIGKKIQVVRCQVTQCPPPPSHLWDWPLPYTGFSNLPTSRARSADQDSCHHTVHLCPLSLSPSPPTWAQLPLSLPSEGVVGLPSLSPGHGGGAHLLASWRPPERVVLPAEVDGSTAHGAQEEGEDDHHHRGGAVIWAVILDMGEVRVVRVGAAHFSSGFGCLPPPSNRSAGGKTYWVGRN